MIICDKGKRRQLAANTLLLATLTVFVFSTIFLAAIGNYGNQGYGNTIGCVSPLIGRSCW